MAASFCASFAMVILMSLELFQLQGPAVLLGQPYGHPGEREGLSGVSRHDAGTSGTLIDATFCCVTVAGLHDRYLERVVHDLFGLIFRLFSLSWASACQEDRGLAW